LLSQPLHLCWIVGERSQLSIAPRRLAPYGRIGQRIVAGRIMNAHAVPVYEASKPEVAELAKKTAGLYANGREFVPNIVTSRAIPSIAP